MAVEKKLAACANILPEIASLYRWEGETRSESETALLLKTTAERVETLIEAVRAAHPYECPCILAWPVTGGHTGFLDWIAESVRE